MACFVCNSIETLKRCSRCKSVFFCSVNCQKLGWPVHKKQCVSPSQSPTPLSPIANAAGDRLLSVAQLEQLHLQGWTVLRNTSGIARDDFFGSWKRFFSSPSAEKDSYRTPSLKGSYMTPYPGKNKEEGLFCPRYF